MSPLTHVSFKLYPGSLKEKKNVSRLPASCIPEKNICKDANRANLTQRFLKHATKIQQDKKEEKSNINRIGLLQNGSFIVTILVRLNKKIIDLTLKKLSYE